jgi:hypothetical protein
MPWSSITRSAAAQTSAASFWRVDFSPHVFLRYCLKGGIRIDQMNPNEAVSTGFNKKALALPGTAERR